MDEPLLLANAFLAGVKDVEGASRWPEAEGLELALRKLVSEAEGAFPNLGLPASEFVKLVAAQLGEVADPVAALASLRAADLYLACACARGIPSALAEFERAYLSHLPGLTRIDPSPAFADEVRQVLREKLFIGVSRRERAAKDVPAAPTRPKIAEYSGRGELGGWVRVVALRTALNVRRPRVDSEVGCDDDIADQALPDTDNPEVAYLKTRYKEQFTAAFRRALGALSSEQRTLLRLYYLNGTTTLRLAAIFHTSRPSISRRLSELREQIFTETRRCLQAELRLTEKEFASLAGALRSQLDISLTSLLKEDADPA